MGLALLVWGVVLYILYWVIRLGVQHGIDQSRLGKLLLESEEIRLSRYKEEMKPDMSEVEKLEQIERLKKLDEEI
ncbi:MAG: hypothetical protein ACRCW2_08905 [Cellulosilyticaceae bacterium]